MQNLGQQNPDHYLVLDKKMRRPSVTHAKQWKRSDAAPYFWARHFRILEN